MMSKAEKKLLLPALIIAAVLGLFFISSRSAFPAKAGAQVQKPTENGVLVVPVQIERDSFAIAMVDTTQQTIWLYRINNRGPAYNRLQLLAARTYRYDKMLTNYNTAEPKPEQVKRILENLGQKLEKKKQNEQTDSGTTIDKLNEPNTGDL